jgi:hypothetical protein
MPANGNAWQRSLQAAESAGRLLDELGVDQTRQIDVFSMCEDLDLWLAFLPMDGLLGAFVPEGTGGVLITDRRPITVQRYTAAHELGHWRLEHGHGLALDGEEHVFGANPAERERLAQMFAANLLMPPPLVLSLLARIGISDHGPVRPDQAYFVAREAGVSYEAAVRQLTNLQVITAADATSLLAVRPLTVKSQLAGGRRPVYGYADVWPVDEQWNDQLVSLRADDEVVVSLPENRSTGYRWMFDDEVIEVTPMPEPPPFGDPQIATHGSDELDRFLQAARIAASGRAPSAALDRARRLHAEDASTPEERVLPGGAAVVGDDYRPGRAPMLRPRDARRARLAAVSGETPASETNILVDEDAGTPDRPVASRDDDVLIAATGRRLLGVRFVEPGPKTLRLQHRSPYSSEPPVEEYVLHAIVEPRRQRFSIDQLMEAPDEAWVGEVRERKIHEPTVHVDDPERD